MSFGGMGGPMLGSGGYFQPTGRAGPWMGCGCSSVLMIIGGMILVMSGCLRMFGQ
jgi:hypothetical protein